MALQTEYIVTMLKYQINDLQLFFENDLRLLKQFRNAD